MATIEQDNSSGENTTDDHFYDLDQEMDPSSNSATKKCIICFNVIPEEEYVQHVEKCCSMNSPSVTTNTPIFSNQNRCFNCSVDLKNDDTPRFRIDCPNRHLHCLICLYKAMHKFLSASCTPVCHAERCDYQLSLHDLMSIPLERRIFSRLLPLIKSKKRPKCPRCDYYIEIDENQDLQQHIESCQVEDLFPCSFCYCPQHFTELEVHEAACQFDRPGQIQRLIDFIVPRTKYPFSRREIEYYIEKKRARRDRCDPHRVIVELAEYGEIFPLQLPTLTCDICTDTYLLEDIFVFSCENNHKSCYKCYEDSCVVKKNSGEVLTCPSCPVQLQYGEINQLRISDNQKKEFLDYQTQKTFDAFSNQTRAFIKCPNQACHWAFEPSNPNERFRVHCPVCKKQFCSLCNQQYHYRSRCAEVNELTQRWFFWCNSERGRYLQMRAQQDSEYGKRLAEYEKRMADNKQRNQELERRYNEAVADENYKVQNCRLCPHCKRVVQRMEGCSSMVCGRDYHGGNQQSGCGKNFSWDQAKPYTASAVKGATKQINDLPRPMSAVVVHENINCDNCHETVQGIRFECVHCPSFILCEKCEQRCTLEHSVQNRQEGVQQHVFRLIMNPGDDQIFFL